MQLQKCCIVVNIEDSEEFAKTKVGLDGSSFGFDAILRNFLGRGS